MKIIKILFLTIITVSLCRTADLFKDIVNGNIKLVKELINNKQIDINARDRHGRTALILASFMGFAPIVKFLLDNGADVNLKEDTNGDTALHIIVNSKPNTSILKLLLDNPNIDVDIKNIHGNTALMYAEKNNSQDLFKLLKKYQYEYLPYKKEVIKRLNEKRKAYIDRTTQKSIPITVLSIINEYAGQDFNKQDFKDNLLTFSQFLEQKEKIEEAKRKYIQKI